MLGDFRKVNEWEKGSDAAVAMAGGKSYFRMTSAERKLHRLPASFDEEVYEEMVKFIGQRERPTRAGHPDIQVATLATRQLATATLAAPSAVAQLDITTGPPPGDALPEERTPMGVENREEAANVISTTTTMMGGANILLQRVGRIKMVWEESVHIWGPPDAQQGRLKLDNLNFLQADQLAFLDHNISANAIEAFEMGQLQGFSTDTFISGQHLKVLGRRSAASSSRRCLLPFLFFLNVRPADWKIFFFFFVLFLFLFLFQSGVLWDRTSYYLSCLKATRSRAADLSRLFKEAPPRDLRFPVRTDVFLDLPADGRDSSIVGKLCMKASPL
ncbi:hypothetical protein L7F22_004670 [Adiantum nelumboides]|nr:hypothetical protein [Adiantum nelumboides]